MNRVIDLNEHLNFYMEFKGNYNLNAVFTHVREKKQKRIGLRQVKRIQRKNKKKTKTKNIKGNGLGTKKIKINRCRVITTAYCSSFFIFTP
jgi:hypothetical protein